MHCFYRGDGGHRRHSSWDSCNWSPQNFLLKPGGGAGQTPQLRTLHQFWNAGYIATAPSPLPSSPSYSRPHNPESPISPRQSHMSGLSWPGGSRALAVGRLLSRPVAGLTGPSPPPSPSTVPRRSCPGCQHQGPGPQVLLHPGVPGLAPPRPSLLPSLSPLLPP